MKDGWQLRTVTGAYYWSRILRRFDEYVELEIRKDDRITLVQVPWSNIDFLQHDYDPNRYQED